MNIKDLTTESIAALIVKKVGETFDVNDEISSPIKFDKDLEIKDNTGGESLAVEAKAGTSVDIKVIWPSTKGYEKNEGFLNHFKLDDFFNDAAAHDQLLFGFLIGGEAEASANANFKYSFLEAGASLKAGVDASYGMIKAYHRDTKVGEVLEDFLRHTRLPANIIDVPAVGHVTIMEYGGYLSIGATLGIGYELVGTPSLKLHSLELSEKFKLNLLGRLGLTAGIAGSFRIEARKSKEKEGWINLVVKKADEKKFGIAADVSIGFDHQLKGLPEKKEELLEALLGLKAANWINLFKKIKRYTDDQELKKYLDNLSKYYIEKLTDVIFDQLPTDVSKKATDFIGSVLESYQQLDDYAIEIFDRFYKPGEDAILQKVANVLKPLKSLNSLEELKGKLLSEELVDIIHILTDGKPLDWLLGQIEINGEKLDSLEEIKKRACNALELIQNEAHKKLQDVIKKAKELFPIEDLLKELKEKLDTDYLKSEANKKINGLVERLIGDTINSLSNSKLGQAVEELHDALEGVDNFLDNIYEKLGASLNQALLFQLHAAYNRTNLDNALIDVDINLGNSTGKDLLKEAGLGRFGKILSNYDPETVHINYGKLTHEIHRESTLSINVVGWHRQFNYNKLTHLIAKSEQRIETSGRGQVTINTDLILKASHFKEKNGEKVFSNMLMKFIGNSVGVENLDEETKEYLINVITRMTATYELVIDDPNTTAEELSQYLSFAKDFGFEKYNIDLLSFFRTTLPSDDEGNYGETSFKYELCFSEKGLRAIFTKKLDEKFLSRFIREVMWASLLSRGERYADIGWCYTSSEAYTFWKTEGGYNFQKKAPKRSFPIPKPRNGKLIRFYKEQVQLDHYQVRTLDNLYYIEENLIKWYMELNKLIFQKNISPGNFKKNLDKFNSAMSKYDDSEDLNKNTFFSLLDAIIKESGKKSIRNSSLIVTSKLSDQEKEYTKCLLA